MSVKAKAIYTIYKLGRIDIAGVKEAKETGVITEAEYKKITGYDYPNP